MPMRAPRPCATPGCPTLTSSTYCAPHTQDNNRATHDPTRKRIYNSKRWKRLRRQLLTEHPWCAVPDCTNPATDLDHVTPLQEVDDPYDPTNLQGLCRKHHSQKTQREVFGRK